MGGGRNDDDDDGGFPIGSELKGHPDPGPLGESRSDHDEDRIELSKGDRPSGEHDDPQR